MSGMAHCCDCGDVFYRLNNEPWKIRCTPCYFKQKEAARARQQERQPEGNFWQKHAEKLAAENTALLAELNELKGKMWKYLHPEPTGLDREIKEHLRALLQYCHPDKHNGSQGATQVTQWLNDVKRRLPCG